MNHPRISVLMPAWNAEKYVASTLETILMQSFTDYEVIVMDGGSRDRTIEILQSYAKDHPNIRIHSEPDEGPYHAIHKAAAVARGEFLVEMCFSDGYLDKDWFAKCVAAMDNDKEISLVWGIPFQMTEEGTLLGPNYIYARFLRDDIRDASTKTPVAKTIFQKIDIRHPSSIIRFAKKVSPATVRSALRMVRHEDVKQKEEWFLYWLKMGTIFPDLNMFMSRKAFFDCMPPYTMGTRETGDWMQFYFDFNSKGFLSYCIPTPANYGRVHKGQVSDRVQGYNDEKHVKYLRRLRGYAKEVAEHPEEMMFIDREGKPIMSLRDFNNAKH